MDASNLKVGYQLLSEDGSWQTVKDVRLTDEQLSAYNLTVNYNHTYFVTANVGQYGVWVHNECSVYLNNIKSYVTPTGRLHRDGNALKQEFLNIGYNKTELLEAKVILERSIQDRKSDKQKYGVLDKGHKDRIALEQSILDRVNSMLKDLK